MTINGPEGLYIPDQSRIDAEVHARAEAAYWRDVAMSRPPEVVVKEVSEVDPMAVHYMHESHDRLWTQLKDMFGRERRLESLIHAQERRLIALSDSVAGYDLMNRAFAAVASGSRARIDAIVRELNITLEGMPEPETLPEEFEDPTKYLDKMKGYHIETSVIASLNARTEYWIDMYNDIFPNHDGIKNKNAECKNLYLPENKSKFAFVEEIGKREALFQIPSRGISTNILMFPQGNLVLDVAKIVSSGNDDLLEDDKFVFDLYGLITCGEVAKYLLEQQQKEKSQQNTATVFAA